MRPMSARDWNRGLRWLRQHLPTVNERYGRPFRATPDAPNTLEAVTRAWQTTGPVPVWNGGSGRTVYGSPLHNYAFRAWHDSTHVRLQTPFSPAGEKTTALAQVRMLLSCTDLGTPGDRVRAARLVYEDIVAQVEHCERYGDFPVDQLGFQRAYATRGPSEALACPW